MPRVDHPLEQWFDRQDLQLGTASQLSDRGKYSDNPCDKCGEYVAIKQKPIGFKRKEQMGMNVRQGKKRGQGKGTKKGGKKGY